MTHIVRPDLLAAVEAAGALTEAVAGQTKRLLDAAAANADVVILTCSSLGPCIGDNPRIIRADLALAQIALQRPGNLVVLYAAPTSRQSTQELFNQAADTAGRALPACHLVPGAWAVFKSGAQDRYFQLIAQEADHALTAGAATIALAQASMAPACAMTQRPADVLNVIDAAIETARSFSP